MAGSTTDVAGGVISAQHYETLQKEGVLAVYSLGTELCFAANDLLSRLIDVVNATSVDQS